MARVFNREKTFIDPVLRPIERLIYKLTGVDENREMRWTEYAVAMLLFQRCFHGCTLFDATVQQVSAFQSAKTWQRLMPHSSFNTAASFTTNTNWQSYVPEVTMSYFTQMAGLAYHNFISAAVGIALAIAFIRGIARREMNTIGNFWVDMVRATLGAVAFLYCWSTVSGFAGCGSKFKTLRYGSIVGKANHRSR